MGNHIVVFVHGWNGRPWPDSYIAKVDCWSTATYVPYSWGGAEGGLVFKGKILPESFTRWVNESSKHVTYLNRFLNQLDADSVDIVAHSLGTRLVHGALSLDIDIPINNVFLCAGAFPRWKSWSPIISNIRGRLFNFSSSSDAALLAYLGYLRGGSIHSGGTIGRPTAGDSEAARGISTRLSRIHNINVSNLKLGHNQYGQHLKELVSQALDLPERSSPSSARWEDLFYWDPAPRFYIQGQQKVRGAKCEIVQVALKHRLENPEFSIEITGEPDDLTIRSVKEFQRQNNLSPDGIVGPNTWEQLVGRPVDWLDK